MVQWQFQFILCLLLFSLGRFLSSLQVEKLLLTLQVYKALGEVPVWAGFAKHQVQSGTWAVFRGEMECIKEFGSLLSSRNDFVFHMQVFPVPLQCGVQWRGSPRLYLQYLLGFTWNQGYLQNSRWSFRLLLPLQVQCSLWAQLLEPWSLGAASFSAALLPLPHLAVLISKQGVRRAQHSNSHGCAVTEWCLWKSHTNLG